MITNKPGATYGERSYNLIYNYKASVQISSSTLSLNQNSIPSLRELVDFSLELLLTFAFFARRQGKREVNK